MQHRSLVLPNIGIDVGHFATKFTTGRSTGAASLGSTIKTDAIPSIAVSTGPLQEFATSRKLDGVTLQIGRCLYFVGKSAPDQLGPGGIFRSASEIYCTTGPYRALSAGAFWYIAAAHGVTRSLVIEHLVVGLPLNTINIYASTVRENCIGTHELPAPHDVKQKITVEVKEVVVVAQPQGAIVNYIESQPQGVVADDDSVLVVDMGGGTFDWFAASGDYQPRYKLCGATTMGTLNCSQTIAEGIKPSHVSNQSVLSRIDKALRTGAEHFRLGTITYSMADYWPSVVGLITASWHEMRTRVGDFASIDHLILTGGGAPLLQRTLAEIAPELSPMITMDPDSVYGNVKGFHQLSEELTR